MQRALVTGGGGFIGGHLIRDLLRQGCTDVRSIDSKPLEEWYQRFDGVENLQLALQDKDACTRALSAAKVV